MREISVLFWNVKGKDSSVLKKLLDALDKENRMPTILALAEFNGIIDIKAEIPYSSVDPQKQIEEDAENETNKSRNEGDKSNNDEKGKVKIYRHNDFKGEQPIYHSSMKLITNIYAKKILEENVDTKENNLNNFDRFNLRNRFSTLELFINDNTSKINSLLFFFVHLADKRNNTDTQQYIHASYLADLFYRLEVYGKDLDNKSEVAIKRSSIIMGDFNMDPFEPGMVLKECFNSSISIMELYKYSGRGNTSGDLGRRFYNPTWQMIGDELTHDRSEYKNENKDEIRQILSIKKNEQDQKENIVKTRYGTFKYKAKEPILDMVLIKKEVYESFFQSVEIIHTELSDHLPILLNLAAIFKKQNHYE